MLLRHGTTRARAESIVRDGPVRGYVEPGQGAPTGFSVTREKCGFTQGTPEYYARKRAMRAPQEGGPAIVEFELPERLAVELIGPEGETEQDKALDLRDEILFEYQGGLEGLLEAWPSLEKRIRDVQ